MPSKGSLDSLREFHEADRPALIALWQACGLLRPWNDPDADIDLCCNSASATLLLAEINGVLGGSVMVGYDGHRGWVYYLAVAPIMRRNGLGRALMAAAEDWLKARHVPKLQLLVRAENLQTASFYARIGYHLNDCQIMQRWLADRDSPAVPGNDDALVPVTLTYLEMNERPVLRPSHLPSKRQVALLRALKPSAVFYRYLYDNIGEPYFWWVRRTFSSEDLERIIHDDRDEIYVLYVDGVPAGFGELDRRTPPDIHLAYFGLLPDFIGEGLGAYLLKALIEIAWNHEPARLHVNTNDLDHPRALPLYQRCGFRPYKQERLAFVDPRRNGIYPPRN